VNRTVLLPLAMIVFAPACSDRPATTAPANPPSLSLTAPDASASSTVCRAYDNELKRSNAALAQNRADRGLQQKVDAYNRIIADACN
jgi:hypothetical protein